MRDEFVGGEEEESVAVRVITLLKMPSLMISAMFRRSRPHHSFLATLYLDLLVPWFVA